MPLPGNVLYLCKKTKNSFLTMSVFSHCQKTPLRHLRVKETAYQKPVIYSDSPVIVVLFHRQYVKMIQNIQKNFVNVH